MCPLDLCLSVLAARCDLRRIYQRLPVEIEPRRGETVLIPAQSIILKALLGHGRKPFSVNIFRLDGGNVPAVSWHYCILGLERILSGGGSTLLWKCAYEDLYIFPCVHFWKPWESMVLFL